MFVMVGVYGKGIKALTDIASKWGFKIEADVGTVTPLNGGDHQGSTGDGRLDGV